MKKTILITGAGGYIGTSLVPCMLKSGYKVRAIDRFFFAKLILNNSRHRLLKRLRATAFP